MLAMRDTFATAKQSLILRIQRRCVDKIENGYPGSAKMFIL
jgi:hypothetical protein